MKNPAAKYFMPYQAAWIQDRAHLKICEKGRQIGLSYADSYDSVRKAAQKDGKDVWVMSRDEVQAKQYILYCKRWATALNYAAEDHGEQVFTTDNGKAVKVQVLSFASGANVYALSSNPDAIVGKTGHVKLDEFALHKDQRQLYAVAKPVIQWGGTLSIISTHRGAGTVFNEIITDIKQRGNKMGWSLHTIPIQLAVEQFRQERNLCSHPRPPPIPPPSSDFRLHPISARQDGAASQPRRGGIIGCSGVVSAPVFVGHRPTLQELNGAL